MHRAHSYFETADPFLFGTGGPFIFVIVIFDGHIWDRSPIHIWYGSPFHETGDPFVTVIFEMVVGGATHSYLRLVTH